MVVAIIIGRRGSTGFPGKNTYRVLERPLAAYPLLACRHSAYVEETFLSTDCEELMDVGRQFGAHILERPPELATSEALAEDVYVHAYRQVVDIVTDELESVVLLFCNAPTILSQTIDRGVEQLRRDPTLDSAVTASCYNMWSPIRARRIGDDGLLEPFIPLDRYGPLTVFNCDRDSQGDVYFADMSASIVRPRCLEKLEKGVLPMRWMGQRIYPLIQSAGCDVDFEWQIPGVCAWLVEQGFSEELTPYDDR